MGTPTTGIPAKNLVIAARDGSDARTFHTARLPRPRQATGTFIREPPARIGGIAAASHLPPAGGLVRSRKGSHLHQENALQTTHGTGPVHRPPGPSSALPFSLPVRVRRRQRKAHTDRTFSPSSAGGEAFRNDLAVSAAHSIFRLDNSLVCALGGAGRRARIRGRTARACPLCFPRSVENGREPVADTGPTNEQVNHELHAFGYIPACG